MAWARSRRATRDVRHAVLVGERRMHHSAYRPIGLSASYRSWSELAELADLKDLLGLATEALEHAVG